MERQGIFMVVQPSFVENGRSFLSTVLKTNLYKKPGQVFTCPGAFLSFSAVSVQTAAVSLPPVIPGSQSCVRFSTAPAVISKPAAILYLSRYSVPVSALLAVPVLDCGRPL